MSDNIARIQVVNLELADGRTATFSGPQQVTARDKVVGVTVTEGVELAPDCYFGPISTVAKSGAA